MKLQDLLIGIGLFALITVIVFGAINTSDPNGIYSENYLNLTHSADTKNIISNISSVGASTTNDFDEISGDMNEFRGNSSGEPTESSLVGDALRVLINLPKSYQPVVAVMRMSEQQWRIPKAFTNWVIGSVIVIVILLLLGSFLKNKLEN